LIGFDSVAQEIYTKVGPLTYDEARLGYPLREYVTGLASLVQEVDDYVRSGPNGEVGWSAIVDVDRAPTKGLPWLAQLAGTSIPDQAPGQTDEQFDAASRDAIRNLAGQKRGRPAAMVSAAQQCLTGSKTVLLRERNGGSAYQLHVVTFTAETPDSAKVLNALISQKPGGIILTYSVISGQDFQLLFQNKASFAAVFSGYVTFQGVLDNNPAE
jgi:hypothetical protein